jgi:hypothetical protein
VAQWAQAWWGKHVTALEGGEVTIVPRQFMVTTNFR